MHCRALAIFAIVVLAMDFRSSTGAEPTQLPLSLKRADPDELVRAEFSPAAAARALDESAADWRRVHGCVQCHANLMYLVARPALDKYLPTPADARELYENIARDAQHHQRVRYRRVKTAGPEPIGTDAIVVAFALTMHDRRTGKLRPTTRAALDRMLSVERDDGDWYVVTDKPADLFGTYTQTCLATIAIASAPEGYADTQAAQAALVRIRKFFAAVEPATPYQTGMRMWAAAHVDGLVDAAIIAKDVAALRKLQHDDGGWSIARFLADNEKLRFGRFATGRPSDAFGTGFATYVLRQAGVAANDPQLQRAAVWLKANQRESGRWVLESLVGRPANVVSNSAGYWAVLALESCGAL